MTAQFVNLLLQLHGACSQVQCSPYPLELSWFHMFVLRGLFVASLAGYWRFFPQRFLMAASSSDGEYSSAFVTCPDTDVAKKIARFVF